MIAQPNSDNRRGVTHEDLPILALGLARTVVLGARIEAERIVVSVRPYKREQRRSVLRQGLQLVDMANRGAPGCGGRWTWRARPATWSARLQGALPEHGMHTEAVPGAAARARFTRDSRTGWRGWRSAHRLGGLRARRVEWHGVGGVQASLRRAGGRARRFRGRRRAPHRHRRDVVRGATSTSRWSSTATAAASSGRTRAPARTCSTCSSTSSRKRGAPSRW